jgi:hypothetical protein
LVSRVVEDLVARLADAAAIAALVSEVESDDDDEGWYGVDIRASELGWHDDASRLVLWLVSEKTTTGEADSPYFHAMGAAAASLVGADIPPLDNRAATLYSRHGDLLSRVVVGQRALSEGLLQGITEVALHRGDATARELSTPADPKLWPLASFAVDFETAKSFAGRKAQRVGGTPVVYSAIVPAARIIATPATGFAVGGEREVVVDAANPSDRATVTAL